MITIDGFNVSIPRGDTGAFDIHVTGYDFGTDDRALFTIKNGNGKTIRRELLTITDNIVSIEFTHDQTKILAAGDYVWDVRWIVEPEYDEDDNLIGGEEIDTPYKDLKFSITGTTGDI